MYAPIAPAAATSEPMAWTGEAQAEVFQQRHRDNEDPDPDLRIVVDDQQSYEGHFMFSFAVLVDGTVQGSGTGEYDEATWHLEGTNGENGAFSCDPPLTTEPFSVEVKGFVSGRTIRLNVDLPDAYDYNEAYDCGADFTGPAGTGQYLRKSLQTVGGNDISFDMGSVGSKTLTKHEQTSEGEWNEIIRDHMWTVTVKHECAESDYSDPQKTEYVNQFAAGEQLDLPDATATGGGKAGGNACGPSSMVMLINEAKRAAGDSDRMDLKDVYTETMTNGLVDDGEDNLFDWTKGSTLAKNKGYDVTFGTGVDFINTQLAGGAQVLASTRFSSKDWSSANPYGAGHVILITGRTADGDYIVSDPAGDYMSSDSGHYGKDKCGSNVVYPKDKVEDRLKNSDGTGRSALGIRAKAGSDPTDLLLIGWFEGIGPSPFSLWVEDESGRRAGFLPSGAIAQEIPTSEAMLDPQYQSNPDAPDEPPPDPDNWPQSVYLRITPDLGDLTMFLEGDREAEYRVEVYMLQNGELIRDAFETGHVATGETKSIPLDKAGPVPNAAFSLEVAAIVSGVAAVAVALLVTWMRRRRPKAPQALSAEPTKPN